MVRLTAIDGWAVLLGLALGVGLWSLASLVPRLGRPLLAQRIAPYIVDVSADARDLVNHRSIEPVPVFGAFLSPIVVVARRWLGRLLGGSEGLELRLRRAGSTSTVDAYRSRQLVWLTIGAAVGALVSVGLSSAFGASIGVGVVVVVTGGAAGLVACDAVLRRAARARSARILDELPTVLEFLTLSLSAGEGILDAIRRVDRTGHGELAHEFGRVLTDVNTGVSLAEALTRLGDALQLAPLTRALEQVIGALDRGTPLAEVLRAQALDSREEAKRQLIELAGRKEVAMLVPLVFLILPVTVVFAIFPGIVVLQLGN